MSRPQDWILLWRTACWSCLTDCIGRGIRWCSSHTMSGQRSAPQGGCILKTDVFSGEIIRHRITGALEPHRRFTLSGRHLLSALATGVHELRQQYAPDGRQVFLLRFSGELRAAERGRLPRPRLGQKGRTTCGLPSSLNSCLSLSESGENRRAVTAAKGVRQRIFTSAETHCVRSCIHIFAVSVTVLLHRRVNQRRVRHNSAAQFVSAL